MGNRFQGKSSVVLGLYGGVIIGALGMIVGGAFGWTTVAELSLIMGICAGPAIGWVIDKVQKKRGDASPPDQDSDSVK